MSALWERISSAMKDRGITKADLARICNVSPSSVQKWEAGGNISLEPALHLENALGISAGELMPRATPNDADAGKLFDRARSHYRRGELAEQPGLYASGPPGGCRIPEGCDLQGQLTEMKTALVELKAQVQTLTQLLGASLAPAPSSGAHGDRRQKAG